MNNQLKRLIYSQIWYYLVVVFLSTTTKRKLLFTVVQNYPSETAAMCFTWTSTLVGTVFLSSLSCDCSISEQPLTVHACLVSWTVLSARTPGIRVMRFCRRSLKHCQSQSSQNRQVHTYIIKVYFIHLFVCWIVSQRNPKKTILCCSEHIKYILR